MTRDSTQGAQYSEQIRSIAASSPVRLEARVCRRQAEDRRSAAVAMMGDRRCAEGQSSAASRHSRSYGAPRPSTWCRHQGTEEGDSEVNPRLELRTGSATKVCGGGHAGRSQVSRRRIARPLREHDCLERRSCPIVGNNTTKRSTQPPEPSEGRTLKPRNAAGDRRCRGLPAGTNPATRRILRWPIDAIPRPSEWKHV